MEIFDIINKLFYYINIEKIALKDYGIYIIFF